MLFCFTTLALAGAAPESPSLRTFDFVTIQLYEGYSHAEYNTTILHRSPADYVVQWVQSVLSGWSIDYTADGELNYPYVNKLTLDRTELVVGCSNGWAGDGKFFLLFPDEVSARLCLYLYLYLCSCFCWVFCMFLLCVRILRYSLLQSRHSTQAGRAYEALSKLNLAPRGFAFWDILDEGRASAQRPNEPVWMAAGLNRFLKVRDGVDVSSGVDGV